jgi:uncharacterized protein
MYKRLLRPQLLAALADTPVVFLNGARQTGKSTLVRDLAESDYPARYLTFDDAAVLAAARHDPAGFVAGLEGPVIIDEVQHAPDILPALKLAVDRDRRPGRFLLTGSANILLLPRVSESSRVSKKISSTASSPLNLRSLESRRKTREGAPIFWIGWRAAVIRRRSAERPKSGGGTGSAPTSRPFCNVTCGRWPTSKA